MLNYAIKIRIVRILFRELLILDNFDIFCFKINISSIMDLDKFLVLTLNNLKETSSTNIETCKS